MHLDANTIIFWGVVVVASWVQTLTGFALGLMTISAVGLMGLMPLPQAAIVVSVLAMTNAALVLLRGWRDVDRPALALILLGAWPGLVAGYALLGWLAGSALGVLQVLLGLVIAGSALQLAMRPRRQPRRSPPGSFVAAGLGAGLMGGLFATAGPPVIWQLYRQPMPLNAVRTTLLAVFLTTQIVRLALALADGAVTAPVATAAAGAIPAVLTGTFLARRFPPPVSSDTIRRLALGLLFASGLALIATAAARLA